MKPLTKILSLASDDALFDFFHKTLNLKGIMQWDYWVDWEKVYNHIKPFEVELNILNVLIGKADIKKELMRLLMEYPKIINVIPLLLAIRFYNQKDKKINIIVDKKSFKYEHFDLSISVPNEKDAENIADFFMRCGLADLIKDKKVKNLCDYATGVEVGLDSNGRKNRGGQQMENIVAPYIDEVCQKLKLPAPLAEANASAIKKAWGIDIKVDKSSRRMDFVVNHHGQLYFFEVNFYNGGGSKLKSTATEYIKMNEYWNQQNIRFIWITDGAGWLKTLHPLREYFDKADYLLNLEMLKNGILHKIIQ